MRSPSAVLLLISCFFVKFARSQSNELLVEGQTGKLYLEHTVVAKDNWYSVGRLYNITPKELTAFNHRTLTPLTVGQKLEIPLTAVNFSQTGQKAAGETLVPVYYVIQEKEWMYRISVNHNKVSIPSLEKWNNVNKDQIHAGMHLIVGFLKVKTALSALAANGAAPGVAATKGGVPVGGATGAGAKVAAQSGGAPVGGATGAKVSGATEAGTTSGQAADAANSNPPATVSGETAKAPEQTTKVKESMTPAATPSHNGGSFKGDYGEAGKSATGLAGTFKSTSGWQDGKYYALMNNTPVGTIVRVTDPSTGKTIYAKVLGQLPDMKESAGLSIRISNAAAAELGEGEGKFNVEVKY